MNRKFARFLSGFVDGLLATAAVPKSGSGIKLSETPRLPDHWTMVGDALRSAMRNSDGRSE